MKAKEEQIDTPKIVYTVKELVSDINAKVDKILATQEKLEAHVKETNGKVKLNRWISTTALTLLITLMGWFFTHVMAGG